jgi:transcriptional regulator with XRE-family HTH domain
MPSVDPIGEVARQFALNLRQAIGDRTLRSAAEQTNVDYSTIHSILQGRSWPDVYTLAKLERGLETDLWPGRIDPPAAE